MEKEMLHEFLRYLSPRTFSWDSEKHRKTLVQDFLESYQPERSKREDCNCDPDSIKKEPQQ